MEADQRLVDINKIDLFHQDAEDTVFDLIHAEPVDAIPVKWLEDWPKQTENGRLWNDIGYQVIRAVIRDWEERS